MLPYLTERHGNPSSIHSPGRVVRAAIDQARTQVADLVGAHPTQVIFTSGGTEANNLAFNILSNFEPGTLCVSAVEHPAVLEVAKYWQSKGWQLEVAPVDSNGVVDEAAAKVLLAEKPTLFSCMIANNETGAIQPVAELAKLAGQYEVICHTDAVQAVGKIEVDFESYGVNLMSLSSHKIYGPKGVGALIVDKSLDLSPLIIGGGHEKGWRSGTENVAGIVGFGKAAEIAKQHVSVRHTRMSELRDNLQSALKGIEGVHIISESAQRLPNTLLIAMPGIEGETLLMNLDAKGFAVSSGSACASANTGPSHVLEAMHLQESLAQSTLRISLGKDSTWAECEQFVMAVRELRLLSQQMASVAW